MTLKISPSLEGNRSQKGAGGGRLGLHCLQSARWCLQLRSKDSDYSGQMAGDSFAVQREGEFKLEFDEKKNISEN